MAHHDVKLAANFCEPVNTGRKTFEIRKNDRNYMEGDTIRLHEWAPEVGYSGRYWDFTVGYVTDYAQTPGYVVFSIHSIFTP